MKSHLEQKVEGLKSALTQAGIGAGYHRRTLKDHALDLYESLNDVIVDAQRGTGIIFVGGAAAYDHTMVLARALVFRHVSTLVVQPMRLARWLETDAPVLDELEEIQALFVPRFQQTGDSPFTGHERFLIEEFLTNRIDNSRAFYAQVSSTLHGSRWWSEEFVKRLQDATIVRVCDEPRTGSASRTD